MPGRSANKSPRQSPLIVRGQSVGRHGEFVISGCSAALGESTGECGTPSLAFHVCLRGVRRGFRIGRVVGVGFGSREWKGGRGSVWVSGCGSETAEREVSGRGLVGGGGNV